MALNFSTDSYIEWLAIALCLTLALMFTLLIRQRARAYIQSHPFKRLSTGFIEGMLTLLDPLLAVIALSVAKPLVSGSDGGMWITAATHLCFAYFVAKVALLFIQSKIMGRFIAAIIMVMAMLDISGFMAPVTIYLDTIAFEIGTFKISMLNLIHGIVILVIVFWLAGVASNTLENYLLRRSSLSYNARELTVKFFRLFVYFVALTATLSAVGVDLTAFAVFGGALGVGIGLGLQQLTSNFVSGVTLLLEKSVKIGDLVEVGDTFGWIRRLNIRYTLLETFDGRELMIPNQELMATRVTNWTHSNTRGRVDINVGVAYGSDVRKVRALLLEAATEHPGCLKDPGPSCWLLEFADSSLNFLLVFWVADVREGRYGPKNDVMMAILDKFDRHGVEIPFPQRVLHMKERAVN